MKQYIPNFELDSDVLIEYGITMETYGHLKQFNYLENLNRIKHSSKLEKINSILKLDLNISDVEELDISLILEKGSAKIEQSTIDIILKINKFFLNKEKYNYYSYADFLNLHKSFLDDDELNEDLFIKNENEEKSLIEKLYEPKNDETSIKSLLYFIKHSKYPALINQGIFYYEFLNMSPFKKNNNLVARLWQILILSSFSEMFLYLPYESLISDLAKSPNSNDFIINMLRTIRIAIEKIISKSKSFSINHSTKTRQLLRIMTEYGQSAKELMDKLGLKSLNSFRKNYLNPAIKEGFIKMTIPGKPTSKNQTYYKK